jgi:hypothetical protein
MGDRQSAIGYQSPPLPITPDSDLGLVQSSDADDPDAPCVPGLLGLLPIYVGGPPEVGPDKIKLMADAFIPSGIDPAPIDNWFPEPGIGGPSGWEFKGDARGFGTGANFTESRLWIWMEFPVDAIGKLDAANAAGQVTSGYDASPSKRRRRLSGRR